MQYNLWFPALSGQALPVYGRSRPKTGASVV